MFQLSGFYCICFSQMQSEADEGFLGRALGHFVFSLIGLKRILFTNIFQKQKPHLVPAVFP